MPHTVQRTILRLRRAFKRAGNAIVGAIVVGALRLLRLTDPDKMADLAGWLMRNIGPWLPEHKIARANLAAAFPDKSAAEIERILSGTWDNLGRVGVEFAHLDRLWDYDFDHPERALPFRHRAGGDRALQTVARRRQAGAGLRRPSRQLGTARHLRRRHRHRQRGALSPAQYRRHRPLAAARPAAPTWAR